MLKVAQLPRSLQKIQNMKSTGMTEFTNNSKNARAGITFPSHSGIYFHFFIFVNQ
jgi:hypothetical protein